VAYDSSTVTVSGGTIGFDLFATNSSTVTVSGGTITDRINASDESQVILWGSDFAVDGTPVDHGALTSIFGGSIEDEPSRHITGMLANGGSLDNDFYIGNNASIVLIPEPTTLLLLGLGGLALLRRKR
jgi:hypothetical protein